MGILVQSSSITTSTFTPLVGMGVIRLEQMYPITLGANIGTTITALLAALLSTTEAMQVALAHLFFNISGILVWYPIPFMRNIPLNAARQLGKATRIWRGVPIVYILVAFMLIPVALLGLSIMFTENVIGLTVLGSIIVIFIVLGIAYLFYWWYYTGGKERCITCMTERQARTDAINNLPTDMTDVQARITSLEEHTGLLTPEDIIEQDDTAKDEGSSEDVEAAEAVPVEEEKPVSIYAK